MRNLGLIWRVGKVTDVQKTILGFGTACLLIALLVAPFDYRAHNEIAAMVDGRPRPVEWTTNAPIWSIPEVTGNQLRVQGTDTTVVAMDSASLNSGKLMVRLLVIVVLTGVAVLMAGPTKKTEA